MAEAAIHIIDDIVAKPGKGEALFAAYRAHYVPGAEARGMTLISTLVEPPFWLDEGSNRLLFIWTLPTVGAVWGKNLASRQDPAVQDWWWREAAALIATRRRSTLAPAEALAALSDV